jgi:hypothetical protein
MGWYVAWVAGIVFILVPLFQNSGVYYDAGSSAFVTKAVFVAGWTALLYFVAKTASKSGAK